MTDNFPSVEVARMKAQSHALSEDVIPHGPYCYTTERVERDEEGRPVSKIQRCPYWGSDPSKGEQQSGYCSFLDSGDWEDEGTFLLWDMVKECGVNDGMDAPLDDV